MASTARGTAGRLLLRELGVGALNAALWALVVSIAIVWFHKLMLAVIFGLALIVNLLKGVLAGTLLPIVLNKLGIDPTVAAA